MTVFASDSILGVLGKKNGFKMEDTSIIVSTIEKEITSNDSFEILCRKSIINSIVIRFTWHTIHTENNLTEIMSCVQTTDVSFILFPPENNFGL